VTLDEPWYAVHHATLAGSGALEGPTTATAYAVDEAASMLGVSGSRMRAMVEAATLPPECEAVVAPSMFMPVGSHNLPSGVLALSDLVRGVRIIPNLSGSTEFILGQGIEMGTGLDARPIGSMSTI
jgi:hypothetical protein